jgi:hypothetical protein
MSIMPRKLSLFTAAAGLAAALWIAAPAMAAEIVPPGSPAASMKTASVKHHHYYWPRYRVASWYTSRLRYADASPVGWRGYFSPHPVLLMVGIAY